MVRLGWKLDGGYVIPKQILNKIDTCLSFRLGDNFSFEKDLHKINPSIKIYVFDPFIDFKFWFKHFFLVMAHIKIHKTSGIQTFSILKLLLIF